MSLEAQFLNAAAAESAERGERVRFTESLAVFEDMHRALKARLAETPEHRALDGLDAVLALVQPSGQRSGRHLDLDGFAAFRGSVELLHDNTPEARALQLFEGALRSMIASASDFDDLPDVEDEAEAIAEDASEAADAEGDVPVVVAVFEAQDDAADDELSTDDTVPENETLHASTGHETADDAADDANEESKSADEADEAVSAGDDAGDTAVTDDTSDSDPDEIRQRIVELEAELAAARANQAA